MIYLFSIFSSFSYIKYSNIAAALTRRCAKEEVKKNAAKREENYAKIVKWVDGKMIKNVAQ
jgi:hypothetical protein